MILPIPGVAWLPWGVLGLSPQFQVELTVRSAKGRGLGFANEPIVQVEGPPAQCQLVETAL